MQLNDQDDRLEGTEAVAQPPTPDPETPKTEAEDQPEPLETAGDPALKDSVDQLVDDIDEDSDALAEEQSDALEPPAKAESPDTADTAIAAETLEPDLPEPHPAIVPEDESTEAAGIETANPAATDAETEDTETDTTENTVSPPSEREATAETKPSQDDADGLAIPVEFDPSVIEASLVAIGAKPASLDLADPAAKAEADKDVAGVGTEADQPAAIDGQPLEIDWDQLVESGFIDPRDRSEPLPRRMDPIIRTLVRQALSDQASWRDRVILVTSPVERVSKTTAAINFAFGLSTIADHKAVLVDVDTLGSGAVGRLGGGARTGISEALADEDLEVADLVISSGLDHLTLVASGAPDEDLIDHFGNERMLQILRYLTEEPEALLIIDAPPILVSQEAAVLNVIAGQVVLAVEAGRTTADEIEHALQRLGDRHNVSLVLTANSGVVRHPHEAQEDIDQCVDGMPPEAEEAKRRLLKAAAIFAVALGFFVVFSTEGQAHADTVLLPEALNHAIHQTEPRSQQPRMPFPLCHRACW